MSLVCYEPYLLDEKILPLLDAVEAPRAVPVPLQHAFKDDPATTTTAATTEYFLNDFENVYNSVALTPPQSPPAKGPPMLATLEPISQPLQQHVYPAVVPQVPSPGKIIAQEFCPLPMLNEMECNVFPNQQSPDIALELAEVEELVRSRVEDMQWSSSQSSSSSSPRSPESSSCSNFGDCSSDDPEWVPEPVTGDAVPEPGAKPSRKRARAYSKTPVEAKKLIGAAIRLRLLYFNKQQNREL
ncbi:unnamed protein product [Acanthoscelides obtectus]|uniref:Uncharacterized protein n=1 Tax=Acanthoscelides obtectus TaxID=200917 RepID=A0A9P0L953_ACAOB|nr:unnamed protein product [Acanthoscelides obtectus]CAK1650743.1 hypothetical protein AOBTE_LOCUS16883 [Acanthoscelides obtectus]